MYSAGSIQRKQSAVSAVAAADSIGCMAYRALLEEVYTTPKPGLVDLYSNGAHRDMDVHTFERSAAALRPFFADAAFEGMTFPGSEEELFLRLRRAGKRAEEDMYAATGGVNTHKGLIFTMGLYCAAAGRCLREGGIQADSADGINYAAETVLRDMQCRMTNAVLSRELNCLLEGTETCGSRIMGNIAGTHGTDNIRKYGTLGIRGEALAGFPALWNYALPCLREGVREGHPFNAVKIQTLFVLMAAVEDSNIVSRRGPEMLNRTQRMALQFLREGGAYAENAAEKLIAMDAVFIRENISPGGCADLLAMAIFLTGLLDGQYPADTVTFRAHHSAVCRPRPASL